MEKDRYADNNFGQEPSHAYLAKKLNISLKQLEDVVKIQPFAVPTSSLNALASTQTKLLENPPEVIDIISSNGADVWDMTGASSTATGALSRPGHPTLAFAEAHQLRTFVHKQLDKLSLVDRTLVAEKFGLHGASWSGTTEESALMARRYFTATVLEGGPAGKAGSKRGSGLYGSLTHMARAAEVSKFLAKARYQTAMDDLRDYFVPFADEFELIGRMPIAEDCW
mmetsp:Transcript_11532/g.17042  ORF Transcript_11532/g.17042 Transcript_11532/m.17042 type:complete len:225 (-) Transcript_11532:144-818(-)